MGGEPGLELLRADAARGAVCLPERVVAAVAVVLRPEEFGSGDLARAGRARADDPGRVRAVREVEGSAQEVPAVPTLRGRSAVSWLGPVPGPVPAGHGGLGDVPRQHLPLPNTARGGCFVDDARGQWWVCFHVEVGARPPAPDVAVGIDLGLATLATLSTGEKIEAPRTYRRYEDKLRVAQRANNRDRVRALHARIANARRDHMRRATARIARSFRHIFVGDVSSSRLARTPMGKSVHDAGWSTFRNSLRYKARRHGGTFREVDEVSTFTTQTCSTTGTLPPERPRGIAGLGMREWACSACGEIHDRDVNAAQNILALGLSAQPLAEESRAAHGR